MRTPRVAIAGWVGKSAMTMPLRMHVALTLTLAALGPAPGAAHLLEMPVKLAYPVEFYAAVTSTLYAWYGIAGGTVQVAAAISAATLAVRGRRAAVGGTLAAAAAALVISLLLWGALVAPVNARWAEVEGRDIVVVAAAYGELRRAWEFGHLAAFIAWLTGWLGLAVAAPGLTAVYASPTTGDRQHAHPYEEGASP